MLLYKSSGTMLHYNSPKGFGIMVPLLLQGRIKVALTIVTLLLSWCSLVWARKKTYSFYQFFIRY